MKIGLRRRRLVVLQLLLSLLLTLPIFVQSGKAVSAWIVYWQEDPNYDYTDAPYNMSKTITISDFYQTVNVSLAVSVYTYHSDTPTWDLVCFRVSVYVDSFGFEGFPPTFANGVNIYVEKDTGGSNLDRQTIKVLAGVAYPGRSQGLYLKQTTHLESTFEERTGEALSTLAVAVVSLFEPIDIAVNMIELAFAYAPDDGVDFQDAGPEDITAYSYWTTTVEHPGDDNPFRQYCFNEFHWFLKNTPPDTFYGIKVWAYVYLEDPVGGVQTFDVGPVYLQIVNPNPPGGGCPYVSTWNGTRYVMDNNLIPAAEHSNGTDVSDYYKLQRHLALDEGKYSLLVSDTDKHSYLDEVQLLSVDHESDVKVAVSPQGEILTYRTPAPPQTAVTREGYDVVDLVNSVDGSYYEGWPDDYLIVDFGNLDVTNGAKLVITSDAICPGSFCKESVHVQVMGSTGWTDVASFIPRLYWSTDIIDLSANLPDIHSQLKVRLYFTGNHKIDFIGLDTSRQAEFDVHYANLVSAIHSEEGNVKHKLSKTDGIYAELLPGEQIKLELALPANPKDTRTYIIYVRGHYYTISNED